MMKEFKFKNTYKFSEAANTFILKGYYTDSTKGTPAYKEYWTEQKKRCIDGYEVEGTKITGEHYFYLNFCPIKKVTFDKNGKATKISSDGKLDFPNFWDGDYNYFWIKQIARYGITQKELDKLHLQDKILDLSGGKHLIIGKARRKGFSYKNASIALYQYTFYPKSLTLILAFDKKYLYPEGTMTMVRNYSDFINEYTGFRRNRLVNKQEYIKSGFIEDDIEKGYKSGIMAISLKDNPEGASGKDPTLVLFEEAGTFNNIIDSYGAVLPSVKAGGYVTGQIIIYGTGGDMDSATQGFEHMFNAPEDFEALPFENRWDAEEEGSSIYKTCGWFYPCYLNKEMFIDKDGNSDIIGAKTSEIEIREEKRSKSKDKSSLNKHIIFFPFCPKEAFSISNSSIFPIWELKRQLDNISSNPDIDSIGVKGRLVTNEMSRIEFIPDTKNELTELDFPIKNSESEGCIVIWEQPNIDLPEFTYIAGLDPYSQDNSTSSSSLGSIFIYKRSTIADIDGDRIVAEYTGRPNSLVEFNEIVRKLLLYYNATCMYENQVNNTKAHFEHKNCLHLLANTPKCVKAAVNSRVNRTKGLHMTKDIKNELEIYVRDWLMDLNPKGIPNVKLIYSKGLLNELIRYNSDGNFDRAIACMMTIVHKIELTRLVTEHKKEIQIDPFFTKQLYTNKSKQRFNKF